MKSTNDRQVQSLLKQLHPNVKVRVDQTAFDIHQKNKTRHINPLLYQENRLIRASEFSEDVRKMNAAAEEKFQQGVYVKII